MIYIVHITFTPTMKNKISVIMNMKYEQTLKLMAE